MDEKIGYVGFSNETLNKQPKASEGDLVPCPQCEGKHPLECSISNGKKSDLLMFYRCGVNLYVGAVAGRWVIAVPADCKGEIDNA